MRELLDPDLHPGTQTSQAGVDRQAGRDAGRVPGESATGSRRSRAAVEPVAKRTGGTDFCPRLRNWRRETKMASGTDQRPKGAPAAVMYLQSRVGDEEMLLNEQVAVLVLWIQSAATAFGITRSNLALEYNSWMIPNTLTFLRAAAPARYASWSLRLIPDNRGSSTGC